MNKRCNCDKRKRPRRTIKRILIAILLAILLHGYVSLNVKVARQGDKIRDVNNALIQTQAELKTVSSQVSAVQAAVVETKVALSVKQSVGKPVKSRKGKPVTHEAPKTESTYVDPVSTFVVGGVLTVGKSIITNGGRLIDAN